MLQRRHAAPAKCAFPPVGGNLNRCRGVRVAQRRRPWGRIGQAATPMGERTLPARGSASPGGPLGRGAYAAAGPRRAGIGAGAAIKSRRSHPLRLLAPLLLPAVVGIEQLLAQPDRRPAALDQFPPPHLLHPPPPPPPA